MPLLETPLTDEQRATALYFTSWIAADRGDYDRERTILADALPLAESVGGKILSWALVGVAWSQANAGELDEARASAERGLATAIAIDDPIERGRGLMAISSVTWPRPATTTSRSGTYEKRSSLPSRPAIWNSSAPLAAISVWSST